MDERAWGRGRGGAHAEPPATDDAVAWIGAAVPSDWFTGPPEVVIDRDEIVIVGTLPGPKAAGGATDAERAAAEQARIAEFRESSRDRRVRLGQQLEHRYRRKIAWGAVAGGTRQLFSTFSAPVMTRLSPDTEAAQGSGTYESTYTQTGAVPGHPEPADATSRFRPAIIGAQSQSIDLITVRGGWPGRDGAAVAYRLDTDSVDRDYRGWDDPNVLCDVISLAGGWQTATDWSHLACATVEETGIIVVVARSSTGGQAFAYNPRTGTWTAGHNFSTDPGLDAPIALAYDTETRRLILWSGSGAAGARRQLAYYSEDNGATWAIYSRGMWDARRYCLRWSFL